MANLRRLWFIVVCLVGIGSTWGFQRDTFWGEKAPPGCNPCPKGSEGLFDTPVCGMNGIAYKNYCYLTLRNCIAKILKKNPVDPSKDPSTCGLQTKIYNSFVSTPFKRKKRDINKDADSQN